MKINKKYRYLLQEKRSSFTKENPERIKKLIQKINSFEFNANNYSDRMGIFNFHLSPKLSISWNTKAKEDRINEFKQLNKEYNFFTSSRFAKSRIKFHQEKIIEKSNHDLFLYFKNHNIRIGFSSKEVRDTIKNRLRKEIHDIINEI